MAVNPISNIMATTVQKHETRKIPKSALSLLGKLQVLLADKVAGPLVEAELVKFVEGEPCNCGGKSRATLNLHEGLLGLMVRSRS